MNEPTPETSTPNMRVAPHPKISLVITTRNRRSELDRFLSHLDQQTYRDFEALVIDQNAGEGVSDILSRRSFRVQYFQMGQQGAARGRNLGLEVAQGDILAIPDDDCWYPPDLLAGITAWFDANPEIDLLCTMERNERGEPMVPRGPVTAGFCTREAIGWRKPRSAWIAQSSMVFMRKRVCDRLGLLNPSIGVGADTPYQSGEETDYFLRALESGFEMWYEPSIHVFHPELRTQQRLFRTVYPYSLGMGYTLRLHRYSLFSVMGILCRALGGAATSAARAQFAMAFAYLRRAQGIINGYFRLM